MIARFDEAELVDKLKHLDIAFRVIFATACAERLMPAYLHFHALSGEGNPQIMCQATEDLWSNPVLPEPHDKAYDQQLKEVMALIPMDDDIGGSWTDEAIYSQSSGICLAYALSTRLTGEAQEAAWAARNAYGALDYFVINRENIDTSQPGGEQKVISHPIIQTELGRQLRDLDELLDSSGKSVKEVAIQFRERARAEAGSFFGPAA